MITIVTSKKWQKLLAENRHLRDELIRHGKTLKDLCLKMDRMEKAMNEAQRENRLLKGNVKRMEKQQNETK